MTSSLPPHLVIVFGYNRVDKLKNRLQELRTISPPITDYLRTYEFVIVVEDDISVSEGFYNSALLYMAKKSLQEKYASFSGYSIFPAFRGIDRWNLLRESPYFACWGWVVSRENWKDFKVDIRSEEITKILNQSKVWNSLNRKQKETWLGRFRKSQDNPWNTCDIQFQYHSFKLDKLNLAPTWRIVENEGFDDPRSTHTQNTRPRIMGRFRFSNIKVRSTFLPKFLNKHATRIESHVFFQDSRQLFNLVRRLKN